MAATRNRRCCIVSDSAPLVARDASQWKSEQTSRFLYAAGTAGSVVPDQRTDIRSGFQGCRSQQTLPGDSRCNLCLVLSKEQVEKVRRPRKEKKKKF